jgi:hypothetical protein
MGNVYKLRYGKEYYINKLKEKLLDEIKNY